jgi:adenosine deaminase CECR1
MKGLFAYETAFRSYTRACIQDFANDNIQYAEIRPNFMYSNSLKSDDGQRMYGNRDIVKIIEEELEIQKEKINAANGQYFGGMKVIYCTPRSFSNEEVRISLNECIDLKAEFSDLICGKYSVAVWVDVT